MRILALSHIFPPAVDGGSQIVFKLAKNLESKHKVFYISSSYSSTDQFTQHPMFRIFRKLGLPTGPFLNFSKLIQMIIFRPDWIIAGPLPTTIIFYARIIQLITKSKVLFIPCYHENNNAFRKQYFYNILKHFHLWVFTDHEKKMLSIYCHNIIQHFPGVDTVFLRDMQTEEKNTRNKILFLGNLASHKGIIPLMQSISFLPNDYTLTICGQKTLFYPKILKYKTKKIKIIAKKYNQKQAIELINSHDILALPSSQESFGLVLIEAMARGKPVLGINIPTTREVITKTHSGVLAKSQTAQDIALAIAQITNQSGYSYVKKYCTWDTISLWAEKYLLSH